MSSAFDRSVLDGLRAALRDRNGVLAGRMIAAFQAQGDRLVTELEDGARTGDRSGLFQAAHTLRGSSGSLGGLRLAEICERVEHWQGAPSDLAQLVGTVREEVTSLQQALARYQELLPVPDGTAASDGPAAAS